MIATSCATSCYCFCCWYHLPTYLPIHGLTLLSVLEENWIKLTKIDRSFAAMAQQIALRHNYHVSQYQLLPEAGWGSLAGNLATRNCDNIYSKNPCEASYGLQHAQVLYLFYHCTYHSIFNTFTLSYDMTHCVMPVLYSIDWTLARTWICQDVVFTCSRNYAIIMFLKAFGTSTLLPKAH